MVLCALTTELLWLTAIVGPTFVEQFMRKEFVLKNYFPSRRMNVALGLVASSWILSWLFIDLSIGCADSSYRYDTRNACQDFAPYAYQASRAGYWASSINYAGNILAVLAWCAVAIGIAYALYRFGKLATRHVVGAFNRWARTFKVWWK